MTAIATDQAAQLAADIEALPVAGAALVAAAVRRGELPEALQLLHDLYDSLPGEGMRYYDELHSLITYGRAW